MSPLDFIGFWRSLPFRPFRITASGGRSIDVLEQHQVAMAPGMTEFIIATDAGAVALKPGEILGCVVIGKGVAATAAARTFETPAASPGVLQALAMTWQDGTRIVHFRITDDEGTPCLSTAGTRWDLHGVESFENGRMLHLHHADEPHRLVRIIVWPPKSATFDSFAEAGPCGAVERELRSLDRCIHAAPSAFEPRPEYFDEIAAKEKYRAPGDARRIEETGVTPDRFRVESDQHEVGPNHWAASPRVFDTLRGEALLDLWGTGWDGTGELDAGMWKADLRCFPEGGRFVRVEADLLGLTACIDGRPSRPLAFVDRCLRNFGWHGQWDALMNALHDGPQGRNKPELTLPMAGEAHGGWRLELWPGAAEAGLPMLVPRAVGPSGRSLLDLRGSCWGAMVEPWQRQPQFTMQLMNPREPGNHDAARLHLVADMPTRRVLCPQMEGSTALGVLQRIAHESPTNSMLIERLEEAMDRGKGLPVPEIGNEGLP